MATDFPVLLNWYDLNSGTPYAVSGIDGLGRVESRMPAGNRVLMDGGWSGKAFLGARVLLLRGDIATGTAEERERAEDFLESQCPTNDLVTITFARQTGARSVMGKVLKLDINPTAEDNYSTWSLSVRCDDPRLYAGDSVGPASSGWLSASTGLPSTQGGFPFPATIPWTSNGVLISGAVTLTNPGTSGLLELTIRGPITAPSVTWESAAGRGQLTWPSLSLASGEFLVVTNRVPSGAGGWTSMLMGQSSRWPSSLDWPVLAAGPITFYLDGQGVRGATDTLTVRLLPGYGG